MKLDTVPHFGLVLFLSGACFGLVCHTVLSELGWSCEGKLKKRGRLLALTSSVSERRAFEKRENNTEVVGSDRYRSEAMVNDLLFEERFEELVMKQLLLVTKPVFPPVKVLSRTTKKRILVTGGAGFVGSHLVDKLMYEGHNVIVVDNLFTAQIGDAKLSGRRENVEHWIGHPNFELVIHDIVHPFFREVDEIYHLACPASPPHYQYNSIKTVKTSFLGTLNMLGLAKRVKARILLSSTSEVYGDPKVHPQPESYWGHVNPIGPRACYDEGKRVAETLMYAYKKNNDVDVRVARIFNTFGPRMNVADGRVVSNFIISALQDKPVTIYGEGSQTRSFQYVDDLVRGLQLLMRSECCEPVNIGNPEELTILELANLVYDIVGGNQTFEFLPVPTDDPVRRQPDISRAWKVLGWKPQFSVVIGLVKTVEYFRRELKTCGDVGPIAPAN